MYSESQTQILYTLIVTCAVLIAIAVLAMIVYAKTKNYNKKQETAAADSANSLFLSSGLNADSINV